MSDLAPHIVYHRKIDALFEKTCTAGWAADAKVLYELFAGGFEILHSSTLDVDMEEYHTQGLAAYLESLFPSVDFTMEAMKEVMGKKVEFAHWRQEQDNYLALSLKMVYFRGECRFLTITYQKDLSEARKNEYGRSGRKWNAQYEVVPT